MKKREPVIVDGLEMWRCSRCRQVLPAEGFYKKKGTPNGLRCQCKKCHIARSIATRDPATKRRSNREYMRRDVQRKPAKYRKRWREASRSREPSIETWARRQLHLAIRRGEVVKPVSCERCGSSRLIEGHHPDYHRLLSVIWLCSECHGEEHAGS